MKYYRINNVNGIIKDMETGALLSYDKANLREYQEKKRIMAVQRNTEKQLLELKENMVELESMKETIKKLQESLNK